MKSAGKPLETKEEFMDCLNYLLNKQIEMAKELEANYDAYKKDPESVDAEPKNPFRAQLNSQIESTVRSLMSYAKFSNTKVEIPTDNEEEEKPKKRKSLVD